MTAIVPELRTAVFQPKAVGSDQTQELFTIRKGDILLSLHAVLITKVGAIIRLGTDDTATGVTYKMPRVQPIDDTIDIVWDANNAVVPNPKWKIYLLIMPARY